METDFLRGLTYWPRRSGFRWWSAFDRSELREDMQRVAALGLTDVRFCLPWEDVQPAPHKVDCSLLRAFERALDEAGAAGLRVIVGLFPVAVAGALFVPRWIANPDPLADLLRLGSMGAALTETLTLPQVVYEGGYRTSSAADLFRDSSVIESQRYQINEVVGYFGSHPVVRFWQLGAGLERVHPPASDDAVEQWYVIMAETARASHSAAKLLGVTSARGLLSRAGPRPAQLAAVCDMVGVAIDAPLPLPKFHLESLDALEFMYTLACGLAQQPVAVLGLGLPTTPDNRARRVADTLYGEHVTTALVSGPNQAEFIGRAIEQLRAARAPLVLLGDYADYPAPWHDPPLDRSIATRTRGLIDAAGREKPAADAVRAFAGSTLPATCAARSTLAEQLDIDRYWHNPADECARLWRVFLAER